MTEGELTAVEGDVKAGDLLVTDGADKLREGAKVELAKKADSANHNDHNKAAYSVDLAPVKATAGQEASQAAGVKQHQHKRQSAE